MVLDSDAIEEPFCILEHKKVLWMSKVLYEQKKVLL